MKIGIMAKAHKRLAHISGYRENTHPYSPIKRVTPQATKIIIHCRHCIKGQKGATMLRGLSSLLVDDFRPLPEACTNPQTDVDFLGISFVRRLHRDKYPMSILPRVNVHWFLSVLQRPHDPGWASPNTTGPAFDTGYLSVRNTASEGEKTHKAGGSSLVFRRCVPSI